MFFKVLETYFSVRYGSQILFHSLEMSGNSNENFYRERLQVFSWSKQEKRNLSDHSERNSGSKSCMCREDQFRYIKIQPKTTELSRRLRVITAEFVGFISRSLVVKPIVLGWILILISKCWREDTRQHNSIGRSTYHSTRLHAATL